MRGRCQQKMSTGHRFSGQADGLRMEAARQATRQNRRFLWGVLTRLEDAAFPPR
jgi:hypothetical protein